MKTRLKPTLISFDHLTILRGDRPALSNVTLKIREGENVAILGPNGSGKSTFMKVITRECYPLEGEARLLGRQSWDVFELRSHLGIVSPDLERTVSRNVADRDIPGLEVVLSGFFSSVGVWEPHRVTPVMKKAAVDALKLMGAMKLADRPMTKMSAGEARRVLIARALAHNPSLLVLDEPTTSLDAAAQQSLIQSLRRLAKKGRNIVLATHHLEDIFPEIHRVVLLRKGRLFADGSPEEVLTSRLLSRLFEARVTVDRFSGGYRLLLR